MYILQSSYHNLWDTRALLSKRTNRLEPNGHVCIRDRVTNPSMKYHELYTHSHKRQKSERDQYSPSQPIGNHFWYDLLIRMPDSIAITIFPMQLQHNCTCRSRAIGPTPSASHHYPSNDA